MATEDTIMTSFLLSDVQCHSHELSIQNILYALQPRPVSVSLSLVTSSVTVQHERSLSPNRIIEVLENSGVSATELSQEDTLEEESIDRNPPNGARKSILSKWKARASSMNTHTTKLSRELSKDWKFRRLEEETIQGFRETLAPRTSMSQHDGRSWEDDLHRKPPALVVIDSPSSVKSLWQASLAIGGITCAACVSTITEELKSKEWVKKVSINLIAHNAIVDFVGETHKDDIVAAIQDIGYDAALDSVIDLNKAKSTLGFEGKGRTVNIIVEGMFCEHCPIRVLAALECFGDRIYVDKPLTMRDPILRLSYIPEVPEFTIRHIISAISTANEVVRPSIYHPLSLEDRSQQMHGREQRRLFIRVLVTFIVAIPTFVIGIIYMSLIPSNDAGRQFLDTPLIARVSRAQWALFVIATPVYFLCADIFHKRAIVEIQALWKKGNHIPLLYRFYRFGSMNLLMSLGTSIAYISSVAQLIAAGVHPSGAMISENSFYFDSVVFLTLFLLLGRLIESYSKSRTDDAVAMLGKMRPCEALLVNSTEGCSIFVEGSGSRHCRESVTPVDVDLLEFGDIIKVRSGGSPPCDGTIVQGNTKFDESSLTGESKLVQKSINSEVFSGTINKGPPVTVKITGIAGSSMLDQIVNAVREGQTRKAPIEHIADTLTSYFVPCIIVIAIITWIIWLALAYSNTLPESYLDGGTSWIAWSLQFSIAVFVIACPCGLALAAPTALFVGGGLAAKHGILVKGGGEAFEMASKLDCVIFDKTGTLTMGGEPVVTDFEISGDLQSNSLPSIDQNMVLGLIHDIQGNSSHTVAKAIVSFCLNRGMQSMNAKGIEEIPGKGMKGTCHDNSSGQSLAMIIGNETLMLENHVIISPESQTALNSWKTEGKSIALVAIACNTAFEVPTYRICAIFSISDPIRPEAPQIIAALHKRGTDVWMLSGDNQITANAVGTLAGIPSTNIIADVLPHQKSEQIQYLQRTLKASGGSSKTKRALIAMIGDGINDSPALTVADVGIAIGSGSDIAISSAEFVLINSNLNSLIILLDLSRFVFRRIKFNFAWALIYNIIALPIAAGVLYPVVSHGKHVRLDPVWASLAMALSSVSVVCSSLALRSNIPGAGFSVSKDVLKPTEN